MPVKTTMTGSYYRTKEIEELLKTAKRGEVDESHSGEIRKAELRAIRDQLHPEGSSMGLSWISNGEQRKSGYTTYLPNRFSGFSETEFVSSSVSERFVKDISDSNPLLASSLAENSPFNLNKIVDRLQYTGERLAKKEAEEFRSLARDEKAGKIFLNAPSPGVITMFYNGKGVYKDHDDFLYGVGKELAKEYRAILSVEGVDLQIDAPDIGMGALFNDPWGANFTESLPDHVQAINDALSGIPQERIRVHYCYGNYSASHLIDPPLGKMLPEIVNLKANTIVGEMANPRHAGDPILVRKYAKEHGWPKHMSIAAGVIDVKSAFVETPETVAIKLQALADIDEIGPERILGGTDCGFETFSWIDNVPYGVGVKKLRALAEGAQIVS